jgi:WD40 repeat protein
LFDATSGSQLQVFSGHTAQVNDIAFSPDGKSVLTGSYDQTVRLWDITTGKEIQIFTGHTNLVITVGFSLDGKHILTGSEDKTLRLWDIETGRELNQWFIEEPVSALSDDGNYAVGYSEIDNANHIWDIQTLTKTHSFAYSGPPLRNPTQFSLDGKYLLAGFGKEIVLSDVASGQEIQIFRGHTDGITGLDLSPDNKYVISASFDKTVRLWDVETGQEIRRFSGHTSGVHSVAFSSDGQHILTGGDDGSALLWETQARSELPTFNGENDMYAAAFSPDGKLLATNVISNELRLWNVSTGKMLWKAQDSGLALWALDYSPDGRYLVSGNMDGVTTLWDAKTGKLVRQFTAQGLDEINGLAFSPDGKTIVAGGFSQKSVETFAPIWEVETGKELLRLPLPSIAYTVSFSREGKYVLTGGSEGVSQLWDAQTGTKLHEFTGNLPGFSPDGKSIVTVQGSTGFVWDVQTGEEIRRFDGPADGLGVVVYSPDGKTIASATFDGTVHLWDVLTGQESRRLSIPGVTANFVTFSPDSQFVISVGTDGLARFFDVDHRTTMKYLCSILLRDFIDEERAQYAITDPAPTCPKP